MVLSSKSHIELFPNLSNDWTKEVNLLLSLYCRSFQGDFIFPVIYTWLVLKEQLLKLHFWGTFEIPLKPVSNQPLFLQFQNCFS